MVGVIALAGTLLAHPAIAGAGERLTIYPAVIALDDAGDTQRIVVVATDDSGGTRDVTATVQLTLADEGVCRLDRSVTSRLIPLADGQTVLTAVDGGTRNEVTVSVTGTGQTRPISFRNDVIPVFTKAGCNSGSCHGSAQGKNGFRLSLFGYEPRKDYVSLTRDLSVRRINPADPRQSLMLRNPLAEVAHDGGQVLTPDSELTATLLRWIEAYVPDDPPDPPVVTGIEIMPPECVLVGAGVIQQFIVQAHYSDGTDRDVTSLALYGTSDESVATVTDAGLVTADGRGEGLILARFDDFAVVGRLIVLPADDGFVWSETPSFNYIDDFAHAKLRTLHMQSSEVCSDQVFVRRVFLDIVGLLPTAAEYERFMDDESPEKRLRLIDDLLRRPEFPELWAMKWAELLRIESGSRRISHKAMYLYNEWIKSSILGGVPLDRMVRELLGAEGGNFRNPPANFYLVDTSPTQMAENVAQVFMGIRIQCAQCHNHPFERWTQDDYYSFAAFFAQVGKKTSDDPRESIVFNSGSGEVKHLSTGRVMPPKFLGGQTPAIPAGGDRRKVVSEWLTSPENPYFAASFVDRVWAHFMGRGLVEPPDDVRVSNPPSHPALRARLAREFIESNYDLRALVRTIANSRTYQLSTHTNPTNVGDRQNLSHAIVRRLPAETLLDAICQVTGIPEKFRGLPLGARAMQVSDGRSGSYFLDVFGRPPRLSVCTCERRDEPTLSQALHLINGRTVADKISAEGGRLARRMSEGASPAQIIDELYVAAYTRLPSEIEKTTLQETVTQSFDQRQALEDIYWAVLNSKEFLFNH